MSDCEETDIVWEPWTSPGKRKRKKEKKSPKHRNNIKMKRDKKIQKKRKKKNPKFKEAMAERQAKRKEKKKKKNRLALELDDSFICTQVSSAKVKPTVKPETSSPCCNDKLKPDHQTQESEKKTKRKKKVGFDLSPGYIRVKRPKFVTSSLQCPKESIQFENEVVPDSESCSQVTVTGHSQGPTRDDDSQCTSEDINSQDLFITQRIFTVSPSEPSSSEASEKAVTATPQMLTLRDNCHKSVAQIKQDLEGSGRCQRDLHFHQHPTKTKEHAKKPKTVQALFTKEEEEDKALNKAHHKHINGKLSCQTQIEFKANLTEEKKGLCPMTQHLNPYLAEPFDVKPSLDVTESKNHSSTSSQRFMTSTSTQTENLFTTELSSYLNFCQKSRVKSLFEDLKPLDLSLPERARKDLGMGLSMKTSSSSGQIKGDNRKDPDHPSCSLGKKDIKVKKESSGQHPCSVSTQGKDETTLSPQSESEPRSADTTTSSDDSEPPCRTGKLDLTQVRAVQMRLNESFFFKTKGEGQSPRPECPLMKLSQSREVKSRKGH